MASSKNLLKEISMPLVQFFYLGIPAFITTSILVVLFVFLFFFQGGNPLIGSLAFNPLVLLTVSESPLVASPSTANEAHLSSPPPNNCTYTHLNPAPQDQPDLVDDFSLLKNKNWSNGEAEEGEEDPDGDSASCDLFDGRWVIDDSAPSYPPGSCPFVDGSFDCFRNGRPDHNYTKLRWQPKGCSIPRLEGMKMLEILRGKRLVFFGDSLNRNMWESLVCMLRSTLQDKSRVFEASGRKQFKAENSYNFTFIDYNNSIEYFRSPFLVEQSERVDSDGKNMETLRLDLVESSLETYKDADVIIFNSGHWWTHEKTSKGINFYQEGNYLHPQLSSYDAYQKAMKTWARWIDANIDPNRTKVFFRGFSWTHFRGGQWNSGGNCDGETDPITDDKHLAKYPALTKILESVLEEMRTPVLYLNITRMTDYRKDGHPSIYNLPASRRKAGAIQDCSHWCLPGVPDAWNELLYVMLLRSSGDEIISSLQ
ncbi:protein trichome birefringence-like 4 [Typha angustifolia]|uniref:protein trichome birefringence-like 4 n=1 Tax=Typha angustifolia TaxID=59011 RepID=UPI003C307E04